MYRIKIKLFFTRNGKWIYPIIVLIGVFIIIYLYKKTNININVFETVRNWSSETIAVAGTLLGAVIGGVFTLLGSVYVNKKQLKTQTQIKRKNIIYKPLYDELCDIKNNILSENPYPDIITFKTEDWGRLKVPQYTVWDRIKADTRYLETPKTVIDEMEDLYLKINEYLKTRVGNNEEMTMLINDIFQEVIGTQSTIINLGDSIIKYVLEDSQEDIYEKYKFGLKENVNVSEEQRERIKALFYERSGKNSNIQKIKKAKQEWELQQEKVIDHLTDLIKYVNLKYEG